MPKVFCDQYPSTPVIIDATEVYVEQPHLSELEPGDSLMADKSFDIEEYLIPLGVRLNIPPFLRGKTQFDHSELIQTRRVASLRIHVERAMECIKNSDRTLPVTLTRIADRMFFVCCFLSNSHPPLCNS